MRLAALLLSLFISLGQNPGPSTTGAVVGGTTCTLPSGTADWRASTIAGTTNCGTTGTTACANSTPVYNALDDIGSNTAFQTTNTNAQPLFLASQINGLPAFGFNGANGHTVDVLNLTSAIPTANTTYSAFAVISPSTVTATNKLLGQASASTGAVRWFISSSGHQTISAGASANQTGTATLVVNTWVTIGFTWNLSTGAWNMYKCSGGTCSSDGSGTTTATPTQTVNAIGVSEGSSNFKGLMAEMWFLNGTSNTGWASWSQCKYGI